MVKWQLVLVWSSMWSKSETRTFKAFGRTQTPRNMPVDPKWRSTSQNSIGERKEELLSVYVHGSGRFSRQKQLRKCPVGGRMWGWVSATRADTSYMSEEKAASSRKPDAILARVTFLVQANNIRYMIAFPLAFLETWALNFPKKAEMNMVWKKKRRKTNSQGCLDSPWPILSRMTGKHMLDFLVQLRSILLSMKCPPRNSPAVQWLWLCIHCQVPLVEELRSHKACSQKKKNKLKNTSWLEKSDSS